MKRQLAIALGLAVVTTSAFASKARLESLGQGDNGSQYIDDNRSIFLNAAHLNHHKDFVTVEVGSNTTAVDAGEDSNDNPTQPQMEGGVFKSSGNMVYGIYFGDEADDSNGLRAMALGACNAGACDAGEKNVVSFFVAGDAGVQWGAGLTYDSTKVEGAGATATDDVETSAMRARLGAISGNIDAFLNLGLTNTAEDGAQEFEGKLSYDAGLGYNLGGDATAMLRIQHLSAEEAKSKDTVAMNNMHIGVAKEYKLNDKSNLWLSGFYKMDKKECEADSGSGGGTFATFCESGEEITETYLPVTVSLEVQALDWLAVRGFISQDVLVSETDDGNNKSTRNSRSHGVGASFVYGDLSIDGSLLLGGSDTNIDTTGDGNGDSGTAGTLNFDEPMSRLSLNYNF